MSKAQEEDYIALIDRLGPALSGENPRQRLSLFYVASLLSLFACGLFIGFNMGLGVDQEQPLSVVVSVFLAAVVSAAIAGIGALTFINTFKKILMSLDSKKESHKANRISQEKS